MDPPLSHKVGRKDSMLVGNGSLTLRMLSCFSIGRSINIHWHD